MKFFFSFAAVLALAAFLIAACGNVSSQNVAASAVVSADAGPLKSTSFTVAGNCGMCKKRIEKAAVEAGAASASWSADSQILAIKFDPTKTTSDQIERAVAAVGHDTRQFRADEKTYSNLHECCQYPRLK